MAGSVKSPRTGETELMPERCWSTSRRSENGSTARTPPADVKPGWKIPADPLAGPEAAK